jgi:hypothetical protein
MKAVVTDHALIRWLERHHGFDLEPFRTELAALAEPFVAIRARNGAVTPALWIVLDNERVVTVSPGRGGLRHMPIDAGPRHEPLNWKARARKRAHK